MNIASITQRIAILPEVIRSTVDYARWTSDILIARINGTDPDLEGDTGCNDPEHDHHAAFQPLPVWAAGRLGLEFVMVLRSHGNGGENFDQLMAQAAEDIQSPQHAMDVIVALSNMLAACAEETDIEKFSKFFLEAEAGAL